jgi:BirA family biotin operon repressor/biotin-[acetyl-CoA-carboxylase] ligase
LSDALTPQALQLAFRHSRFVRRFFFYPAIGSTNDRAKELASQGAEEGTLVVAEQQTAGRGRSDRGDRGWYSPPGLGIYVSILYRPPIPAASTFGVLAATSLGVASAVESLHPQGVVGVKWPNDLVAEGKKLAGLLTELSTSGGEVDWCVVGVGLNVNHTVADYPADLRQRAISVRQLCNRHVDRPRLLAVMVERAAAWYQTFLEDGMPRVLDEWKRRSSILGRLVRLETAGETYVGTAVAVEDDGALRIRLEGGAEEVLHAADVHLVQIR